MTSLSQGLWNPLASRKSSSSPSLKDLTETSRQSRPQSTSPTEASDVRSKRAASPGDIRVSKETVAPTAKRGRHETRRRHQPLWKIGVHPPNLAPLRMTLLHRHAVKRRHDVSGDHGGLDLTGTAMTARQRPVRTRLNFSQFHETSERKKMREELQDTSKKRKTDENTPSILSPPTPSCDGADL